MSINILNVIVTALITAIVGGICGAIGGYFFGQLKAFNDSKKKAKEDRENELKALCERLESVEYQSRAVLHEMILQKCNDILIRGSVTPNEIDEIEYLFKPYEKANGNGRAKNAYEMCLKLPRRKNNDEE